MASLKERLAQKPLLRILIPVNDRFGEIQGGMLASSIALQLFLSLIPLLLVAIAVVGFVAGGDASFTGDVIDVLGVPVDGPAAEAITKAIDNAQESRQGATIVGVLGLLWRGLAVVTTVQTALDRVWQTTTEGLKDKLRAVLWLLGAGTIFAASFLLGTIVNFLPAALAPLSIALALVVNVGLFLWTYSELGRLPIPLRARLPGAVAAAIGFEVLKLVGTVYVPRLIASSSALYGSLGVVIALLAWLAFFGRLLIYGAVWNVLRWEGAHGTVEIPLEVPRVDAAIAVASNRSGAVVDHLDAG